MQSYKKKTTSSPTDPTTLIVDISEHAEKLMNAEDISDDLTEDQENKLVDYVRNMTNMSHSKISRRYDAWRDADRAHDVYVPADATKFREKAVMADTRAIADTVLTYMMAALAGRNPMFQLEGLNRKSRTASAILERLLHQHLRRTGGEAKIAQMLLDAIRYGFAPTKVTWDMKKKTNVITNFDPRRVFPDPRVQWGDWDKLQFITFVDYCSTSSLMATGQYPKLNMYPELRKPMSNQRSSSWLAHNNFEKDEGRGHNIDPLDNQTSDSVDVGQSFSLGKARITDETWVRFNGYELGLPKVEQIWMVMTVLDESVIIRCQVNPYGKQFPVVIGGLYHDAHKTYSQSLYDLLLPMHEISTWMLRSRIDNVQLALNNLIFADPTQINIADLIDRNPWNIIRTMPGVKPGEGMFIANIPDVTSSHWGDIGAVGEMKQRVSAASDAQQGMPTAPQNQIPGLLAPMEKEGYIDFDITDIQGDIEYLVVDGTLPIEPARNAETWMTMLEVIGGSGLEMEYNRGRIVEEAIRAMGVADIDQFKISQEEQSQGMTPSQQMSMMEKMRGANVVPQDQLMQDVQQGNVVPMKQGQR